MAKKKKILFVNNTLWSLLNFRGHVITSLVADGYEVVIATPPAGSDETAASSAGNPSSGSSKEDWKRSREEAARQRKRANELKKTEAEISRLEEENETIKNEMNDPEIGSNVSRLMELSRQYEENEEALLELYEKWEELSEE